MQGVNKNIANQFMCRQQQEVAARCHYGSEISLMSQVCHDIMQAVNKNTGNRYTFLYEMTSRYHWYTIHHDGHPMGLFTGMTEGSRCSTASISSNASPNVEEY